MSKNVTFIYSGISGLFCQCGNSEAIVMDNPLYHGYRHFSTWRDNSGGPGRLMVACLKCDSDAHNPEVRPRPDDLRERLHVAYPDADIDELLAQCTHDQASANPA